MLFIQLRESSWLDPTISQTCKILPDERFQLGVLKLGLGEIQTKGQMPQLINDTPVINGFNQGYKRSLRLDT